MARNPASRAAAMASREASTPGDEMKNAFKREKFGKSAMVVAIVALVAALGGAAVAASIKIPNASIQGKKLVNNAVTTKKIKNGAVRGNKLATIRTVQKNLPVAAGPASAADTVSCASDEIPIGGGGAYIVTNANQHIMIRSSFKDTPQNGWRVAVHNQGAGAQNYTIEAYCIKK
jgi:hypothetical protein